MTTDVLSPSGHPTSITPLGEDGLGIADVVAVARRHSAEVPSISEESRARMTASVALRDRLIATGQPIYGVTTGVGDSVKHHLSPQRAAYLQDNLVRLLLVGTGPEAAPSVVRAMMLIRANCLARGHSAIRAEAVDLILALLRHDIVPVVPECGSVGASGDLAPLAYLANVLIGSGTVEHRGVRRDAAEALRDCALAPLVLQPKESLALLNGTSLMAAFATLAVHDATELAVTADVCTALTVEALTANVDHFHPRLHAQKPHPGQLRSAARIRALLEGSGLTRTHAQIVDGTPAVAEGGMQHVDQTVQERYSVRCAPHVVGVVDDTLEWSRRWVEIEVNSSNDNPLFDTGLGTVHNGGHFYGGHMGQTADALKIAVANLGDLLDRQLALLVDDKFNRGLPPVLAPHLTEGDPEAGLHHGLKGAQIAASALTAEALHRAAPATTHSRSTESHNQDKVSMGTIATRGARDVVDLVTRVAAIHLLAACQAVDLRDPDLLAPGTRAAFDAVRKLAPFIDADRRLDTDIAAIAELITSGELGRTVAPYLPELLRCEGVGWPRVQRAASPGGVDVWCGLPSEFVGVDSDLAVLDEELDPRADDVVGQPSGKVQEDWRAVQVQHSGTVLGEAQLSPQDNAMPASAQPGTGTSSWLGVSAPDDVLVDRPLDVVFAGLRGRVTTPADRGATERGLDGGLPGSSGKLCDSHHLDQHGSIVRDHRPR
ncbi:HAL/PAL/TAL family ammonia-lyase [Stackebrandtia nassauensis]|uniref:Histidine ammonia-lyase n=1 Tax=Stackebrandtia nassauensis (strain DSM 44728 / CIP 108903 / NRRL B-16338 / NBRC 102104 / LLR-40K-21) TaxID=446470 RepID=D3QAQ1_STANL|nr:aromatic amino acid ammonia-lyase [Stackebrandtia nassauensis]ADD44697.1 Histidine ammonia-lyase [Stackebrandtia nassauensis DSM 44728]